MTIVDRTWAINLRFTCPYFRVATEIALHVQEGTCLQHGPSTIVVTVSGKKHLDFSMTI